MLYYIMASLPYPLVYLRACKNSSTVPQYTVLWPLCPTLYCIMTCSPTLDCIISYIIIIMMYVHTFLQSFFIPPNFKLSKLYHLISIWRKRNLLHPNNLHQNGSNISSSHMKPISLFH